MLHPENVRMDLHSLPRQLRVCPHRLQSEQASGPKLHDGSQSPHFSRFNGKSVDFLMLHCYRPSSDGFCFDHTSCIHSSFNLSSTSARRSKQIPYWGCIYLTLFVAFLKVMTWVFVSSFGHSILGEDLNPAAAARGRSLRHSALSGSWKRHWVFHISFVRTTKGIHHAPRMKPL